MDCTERSELELDYATEDVVAAASDVPESVFDSSVLALEYVSLEDTEVVVDYPPELVVEVVSDSVVNVVDASALALEYVLVEDSALLDSMDDEGETVDELVSPAEDADSWVLSKNEPVLDFVMADTVEVLDDIDEVMIVPTRLSLELLVSTLELEEDFLPGVDVELPDVTFGTLSVEVDDVPEPELGTKVEVLNSTDKVVIVPTKPLLEALVLMQELEEDSISSVDVELPDIVVGTPSADEVEVPGNTGLDTSLVISAVEETVDAELV
ncbi:uncharacterized protein PG986_006277 [Apiospora aurea]|uniref:Uncharacterized protein n=1 Tax=Apiospora aurea TaxID=335848 RepID=A0ABR1QK48_9PEZI